MLIEMYEQHIEKAYIYQNRVHKKEDGKAQGPWDQRREGTLVCLDIHAIYACLTWTSHM